MGDPKLPEARIRPQDGADRVAILRGQARDASVRAGRVAGGAAKVLATLALCGAGLFAIGAGRARPSYDVDKQLDSLRRSQRLLDSMKVDWKAYQRSVDLVQPRYDDRIYNNLDALKTRIDMRRDVPSSSYPMFHWPSDDSPRSDVPPSRNDLPPTTSQQRATLPR
jgi:hypothetical protein